MPVEAALAVSGNGPVAGPDQRTGPAIRRAGTAALDPLVAALARAVDRQTQGNPARQSDPAGS
jgi:hypothetical protein